MWEITSFIPIYFDRGYQGIKNKKDYKQLKAIIPCKATRTCKLTRKQKIVERN